MQIGEVDVRHLDEIGLAAELGHARAIGRACRLTRLGRQFGSNEIVDDRARILDQRHRLGRAPRR